MLCPDHVRAFPSRRGRGALARPISFDCFPADQIQTPASRLELIPGKLPWTGFVQALVREQVPDELEEILG